MDTAQWPQDIMVRPMEGNTCPKPSVERKVRPQKEQQALNCPRCNSTNTKFCYYNNYSLSQPRYFCKTCRRYWTEGGTLRNIPVGGGTRKNKRSSSNSDSNICKKLPDLVTPTQNPKNIHEPQDLNLGFTTPPDFKTITELIQVPNFENKDHLGLVNPSTTCSSPSQSASTTQHLSALELLSNNASRGLMTSFITSTNDPNTVYSPSGLGFSLPADFSRPSLNFSLDGLGSKFGSFQETINGKLLFPFEDLKHNNNNNNASDAQEIINRDQQGDSTGYWNGVMGGSGGGGSW